MLVQITEAVLMTQNKEFW